MASAPFVLRVELRVTFKNTRESSHHIRPCASVAHALLKCRLSQFGQRMLNKKNDQYFDGKWLLATHPAARVVSPAALRELLIRPLARLA